jgi:hypothetical protein
MPRKYDVHTFIKRAALTAAAAAALASISFAGPAQADKTHGGPAATVDTDISFFEEVGITHKKVSIVANASCEDYGAGIDLHGKFKLKIVDVTASQHAEREIDVYKKTIKAKRVHICNAVGLFRVSQTKFLPLDHEFVALVYFDAQKNHQEADSETENTQVGIN